MLCYTTWLKSKIDLIKYIFKKHALTGRIAQWQVILFKFDIMYVTQNAIKGSALANFWANQPIKDDGSMQCEFLDEGIMALFSNGESLKDEEWTLLFDGAFNALGHDIGIVLISLKGKTIPFMPKLCFNCTNNMAEYEACAIGIQAILDSEVKYLKVYGDLALMIYQLKGD